MYKRQHQGLGLDGDEVSGVVTAETPPKLSKKEAESMTLAPGEITTTKKTGNYKKPSISLLNKPQAKNKGLSLIHILLPASAKTM